MRVQIHESIGAIPAAEWNALRGAAHPFLRHEFLSALEASGAVGAGTGWTPRHLTLHDDAGRLRAAAPLYRKQHSFGEFVFDWLWADAWQRAGHAYYPKLVCAVPFSPVTGPRLPGAAPEETARALAEQSGQDGCSGLHCLFPDGRDAEALHAAGFLTRHDVQFHWHNRDYADFGEFLAGFTAKRRKEVRRERRRVTEQGIAFTTLRGDQVSADTLDTVYRFYALTYLKRGQSPYLPRDFFRRLCETLPESVVVFLAHRGDEAVGMAFCLRSDDTLYGRYWGCAEEFDCLHFEACYYQGIDYCIREGLARFEPGTQGEFKIRRGFEPVTVHSAHRFADPALQRAVADWLQRERAAVADYRREAEHLLPYRHS